MLKKKYIKIKETCSKYLKREGCLRSGLEDPVDPEVLGYPGPPAESTEQTLDYILTLSE